jgi:hypothetical protein
MAIAAALAVSPGAAASVHTSAGIKYVTKGFHVKGSSRATGVARCLSLETVVSAVCGRKLK